MPIARIDLTRMTPDLHDFDHRNGAREIVNLLPLDRKLRPMRKASSLQSAATASGGREAVMGGIYFPLRDTVLFGTRSQASSTSHLYEGGIGTSITDLSKTGAYGDSFDQWDFTLFDQWAVATKIDDPVQYLTGTASAFADLITSTTTPKAKFCCTSKTHLVLGWVNEGGSDYPLRVWWSGQGDPQMFDAGTERAGFFDIPVSGGEITGLVGFEEFFLVFTDRGVWRVGWVGGDTVWDLTQIGSENDGMRSIATQSAIRARGSVAIYRSHYGLRMIAGGQPPIPFTSGAVSSYDTTADTFFGTRTYPSAVDLVTGLIIMSGNYAPDAGGTPGGALVYNMDEDRFTVLRDDADHDLGADLDLNNPMALASVPRQLSTSKYLSHLVSVYYDQGGTGKLEMFLFDADDLASWSISSRLVEPSPGTTVDLRKLRALARYHLGSFADVPEIDVTVEIFDDMILDESSPVASLKLTSGEGNQENTEGWLVGGLPLSAPRFHFKVEGPATSTDNSFGAEQILRDFVGLDVDFSQLSER